uniref:Uncharacterized protein n=1 Tax=Panagrolaimus sp. PS1159 TaxID=55785 RepID=A0AC35GNI1_9BILA
MVKLWFSWIFFVLFFIYCSGETNSKKAGLNVDEKINSRNFGGDKINVDDWLNKFLNRTNIINEKSAIKLDELVFDESSIIDQNNKLQNIPELVENENDDQSYEYDTNVPEYSESTEESITPKIIVIKKHQSEKESIEEPFVYKNEIKIVENFVQKSGSDFQDGSATVNNQIFVETSESDDQKISNIDQNDITVGAKIEMKTDGIQDIIGGTIETDFEYSESGSKNYGLQNKADNVKDDEYEYNTNVPEYSESAEDSSVPKMILTEKRESETKNELIEDQNFRVITIPLMHM